MKQREDGTPSKIPAFKSIEEAGEFWDTHSSLDFPGEFEEVEATFEHPLIWLQVTLQLDLSTMRTLEKLAQAQNTEPTTLARTWIEERIALSQKQAPEEKTA